MTDVCSGVAHVGWACNLAAGHDGLCVSMGDAFNPRPGSKEGSSVRSARHRSAESESIVEKQLSVGSHVVYTDQFSVRHDAVVTAVWGEISAYKPNTPMPGCNLVFVSGDETKTDPYGRQIERETSVVHVSNQPAKGRFWSWPENG